MLTLDSLFFIKQKKQKINNKNKIQNTPTSLILLHPLSAPLPFHYNYLLSLVRKKKKMTKKR
jgi:hypothetical protein